MPSFDIGLLYNRYYSELYRYAFSLCLDPDKADEVVHQAFYSILNRYSHARDGMPENFLYLSVRQQLTPFH